MCVTGVSFSEKSRRNFASTTTVRLKAKSLMGLLIQMTKQAIN
jgi:hypothetical protein